MESPGESFLVRAFTRLTQTARLTGASGIVSLTAELLNGWAILIDRSGTVSAASGASRIHVSDALAVAEGRPRVQRTAELVRFPVGSPASPRAFLVVSPKARSVSVVSAVAEHACSLLSLIADPLRSAQLDAIAQSDAVDLLLGADTELARRCAARWGLTGDEFTVMVLTASTRSLVLEAVVSTWLADLGVVAPMTVSREGVTMVIESRNCDALLERIRRETVGRPRVDFHCGVGRGHPLGRLGASRAQARIALEVAVASRSSTQEFAGLPTVGMLLHALPAGAVEMLRSSLGALDIVTEDVRADLMRSVQVFLANNGAWEASALALGVHRHTLKARISRFEELTALSLSNSDDRVAVLLAIRAEADSR